MFGHVDECYWAVKLLFNKYVRRIFRSMYTVSCYCNMVYCRTRTIACGFSIFVPVGTFSPFSALESEALNLVYLRYILRVLSTEYDIIVLGI